MICFFDILLRHGFVKGLSLGILLNRTISKITYYRRKALCLESSLSLSVFKRVLIYVKHQVTPCFWVMGSFSSCILSDWKACNSEYD